MMQAWASRLVAAAVFAGLAAPPAGAADCTIETAVYGDSQAGYELAFRTPRPWEMGGMATHLIELRFPDGETVLWGRIASNMGTSRDVARLYDGCALPTAETDGSSDDELAACLVWEGVVYSLGDRSAGHVPNYDEPPAEALLLADLGRVIRYSGLVLGPGDEPWDVFTLKGCAS